MPKPFIPRPWQPAMIDWMCDHPRCGVFVPMGMGKSVASLVALDALSLVERRIWPALVLAPLRVARDTWTDEASKWTNTGHLEIVPILGTAAERHSALAKKAHIYTVNYENVPWLVKHFEKEKKWPFKTVIADESSRLKSYRLRQGGVRTQALSKIIPHTKRWINLTGTPASNGLQDLWGSTYFLDRGERLGGSYSAFVERWFRTGYDGFSIEPLSHAKKEIHERLSDLCLYIDPVEYFDLKKPIEHTVYVDLPPGARTLYKEMEDKFYIEFEQHRAEAANAGVKTGKLLQIASGGFYEEGYKQNWVEVHDEKITALQDIIEEAAGATVMVVYSFRGDLARLKRAFPHGIDLATGDGLARAKKGQGNVWFAHPASLGHGVDGLQYHCNIIAYFAHTWNAEHDAQILERIGPMRQIQAGLNRNVFVYRIVARNTMDEVVIQSLTNKMSVQDALLQALKLRSAS